ncbi:hypothetical protein DRH29_01780 [candidate division Kazan bacterium]|uniref:Thioredoxin-like fold domain-containing protein n=1 Tax=candidate division Kazan bacterium TaxID=2202143 RepID=A0A420ZD88_UNCK3|nr:MAG: hypothetical protein DRH29_01780 [candidate division Kazan bacterium]
MVSRRINYVKFVFAFLIAGAIFFGGLFLGSQLTSLQIHNITSIQEDLKTSLASLELRHDLLKQNICGISDFGLFGAELGDLGRQLADVEKGFGKNKENILKLKEPYFLLEIRHFLLLQEAKNKCGNDIDLVLYFYSNDPKQCEQCDDQGYILSYLQDKIGYEKIKIYSFDIRSQSPSVQTLMDLYNVERVPLVVINDNVYNQFLTLEEIQEILGVADTLG